MLGGAQKAPLLFIRIGEIWNWSGQRMLEHQNYVRVVMIGLGGRSSGGGGCELVDNNAA